MYKIRWAKNILKFKGNDRNVVGDSNVSLDDIIFCADFFLCTWVFIMQWEGNTNGVKVTKFAEGVQINEPITLNPLILKRHSAKSKSNTFFSFWH